MHKENICDNSSLSYLQLPNELLQHGLTHLLSSLKPTLSLPSLVVRQFYNVQELNIESQAPPSSSFVTRLVCDHFLVEEEGLLDNKAILQQLKRLLAGNEEEICCAAEIATTALFSGVAECGCDCNLVVSWSGYVGW